MRALAIAVIVAGCASGASPRRADSSSEPLAAAIARARAAHLPLVVEFGAPWCKPCKALAAQVLPDARVVAALHGVTFVQYETQTPAGEEAAQRCAVADLPAFVAFDASGAVRTRIAGKAPTAEELVAFLQAAATP